jgi:tetratricopeptide (TPR) repeat protein
VLAALKAAKIVEGGGQSQVGPRDSSLNHLALAGQAIRGKDYTTASQELTSALQSGSREDAGFVMGDSLIQQSEAEQASEVLAEVVRQSPDFAAAHAKLAFAFYTLGRQEAALNEAKVALAQNPQYAEAHKNAGLALGERRRFEVAEQEYQQALRLKPDYAAVYQDLGILYDYRHRWNDAIVAYKKAIAFNAPNVVNNHYNLAIDYDKTGDGKHRSSPAG